MRGRRRTERVRLLRLTVGVDAVPSTLEIQLREHYQQVSEAARRTMILICST